MAVWLVTGATGFLGRHVLDALSYFENRSPSTGPKIIAMGRHCPSHWPVDRFVLSDLDDRNGLRVILRELAPDYVIHLAGRTPPASEEELYRANYWLTYHLLSALRSLHKPIRVVLSGSAAELGPVESVDLPVGEEYVGAPIDAYGRSKHLASVVGLSEAEPIELMVARIFNPIGPGVSPSQAFGRFAAQLARPSPDPLEMTVGDLEARRDFVDVRDVARAMITLALHGRAGQIYHVGTGCSQRIGDGLEVLVRLSGRKVKLCVDPSMRNRRGPSDSRASIQRIVNEIGWEPRIPWEQSLADLWKDARVRYSIGHWQQSENPTDPLDSSRTSPNSIAMF